MASTTIRVSIENAELVRQLASGLTYKTKKRITVDQALSAVLKDSLSAIDDIAEGMMRNDAR